jgi:MinD-like ATPase involved in chromosome partitioning or flagellar assembly
LIDANFTAPNLALHFGIVAPKVTIHDVMTDKHHIMDSIFETEHGFDLIAGSLIHEKINPFKIKDKLNSIKDEYDIILIDSSPNLNEEMLATIVSSDMLLVVTTPDHVTLSTTLGAVKIAKERKTPIGGLILNKVHGKNFELSLSDIEEASNSKVLAVIPYEMRFQEALSKNVPPTLFKNNDSAVEYKKLAAAIVNNDYKDRRLKSMISNAFGSTPKQEINRTVFKEENGKK